MVHRVDYHSELKRVATSESATGMPVKLHLSSKVVGCDPERGLLFLENGHTHEGDLIIGADGIRVCLLHTMAFCNLDLLSRR